MLTRSKKEKAMPNQLANQYQAGAMKQHQSLNHGAVAIEQSRAVTEAQGKLLLAKQFPRDVNRAYSQLMDSCKRNGLANVAVYSYPKGGQNVSGPSIRLAEEIARLYGNIEYGIRELSNNNGESEMEAYAWDLETNVVSSQKFKVKHVRSTRQGNKDLTDSRDIYEMTANMGARRLRSRMLAILPPDFVEEAVSQCKITMQGNTELPIKDRIRQMVNAFKDLSVSQEMIELYIGHGINDMTVEQIADMQGAYNSIKNGQSKREDWFKPEQKDPKEAKPFNPAIEPKKTKDSRS